MSSKVIDKKAIARSFGKAASSYDSVAHFQRWVGECLLDKCSPKQADTVIDLGCGTGHFTASIGEQFSAQTLIGFDLSEQMLRCSSSKYPNAGVRWIAGDAENLPFQEDSVDVIYSSLAIQWCSDLDGLFAEINRVLKPGGIFMFATLLDGTLRELKESWGEADSMEQHVNEFLNLADHQGAISRVGLSIDTLEHQTRVLSYHKVAELTRELKLLGAHNITSDRPRHVTGKARIRAFMQAYEKFRSPEGVLPASYEVLFGVVRKGDSFYD